MSRMILPLSIAFFVASTAHAQLYMVQLEGHERSPNEPVVLTCLKGETPPDTGTSPTLEMEVRGAISAPLSFGYTVFAGEACVAEFEDAATENGWPYVISPVE